MGSILVRAGSISSRRLENRSLVHERWCSTVSNCAGHDFDLFVKLCNAFYGGDFDARSESLGQSTAKSSSFASSRILKGRSRRIWVEQQSRQGLRFLCYSKGHHPGTRLHSSTLVTQGTSIGRFRGSSTRLSPSIRQGLPSRASTRGSMEPSTPQR